jgi:hypothetical protein
MHELNTVLTNLLSHTCPPPRLESNATAHRKSRDETTDSSAKRRVQQWLNTAPVTTSKDGDPGSDAFKCGIGMNVSDLMQIMPIWVTPVMGRQSGGMCLMRGFCNIDNNDETPAAGGPLQPHETALAQRASTEPSRTALWAYHLTDPGLAELQEMLLDGGCRLNHPEEAAVMIVVWLLACPGPRLSRSIC